MSELHKFIFDGLPVRGQLVRLTDAWQELLRRRAANTQTGAYPPAVAEMLGEMTAADTEKMALLARLRQCAMAAMGNVPRLMGAAARQPG